MKYLTFFGLLFIMACQGANTGSDEAVAGDKTATTPPTQSDHQEAAPKTGKINVGIEGNIFRKSLIAGKVTYEITSENNDSSLIHIKSKGLTVREYDRKLPVKGHLVNAFSLDLNNDGFHEIYLIVDTGDGNGQLQIHGITSFNDKSAGEIYVNDVQVSRQPQTDKIYVHYGNLTRQFNAENNQLQVYQYRLKKGEAGYILEPTRTR